MKVEVGTAYYPEDWDNERVEYDARLMREAGMSYVRMGEFAWSHMEPRENIFEFKWLHDAVDIFGKNGVRTILCTPSSAAPAWMCRKYPGILRMKRNGERAWFGVRDHTCYTSKKYRELVLKTAGKMALEFKDDPNIAGWQIDNEAGCSRFPECFCPDCQAAFREYVRDKYKTLENLNDAWRTTFWSGEFFDWDELELEANWENMGSCRTVESKRFRSREQADFILCQAEAIRKIIPDALIGTNNYCGADRYEMFSKLDFAGNDFYPKVNADMYSTLLPVVRYRGLKQGVAPWMLETPPRPGWPVRDQMRFYFWLYVGQGYNPIFYFHWNSHLSGNEKLTQTIIGASGKPGVKYEMLKKLIAEADSVLSPYPGLSLPRCECAIIQDYEADWVYAVGFPERMEARSNTFFTCFSALSGLGATPEIISPDANLAEYKLVVMPLQAHIRKDIAEKLKEFVSGGGVLIMNGSSGMFDGNGKNLPEDGPQHVREIFGMTIGENRIFDSPKILAYDPSEEFARKNVVVSGSLDGMDAVGTAAQWTGYITVSSAEILLTFANSELKGRPFCTVNRYGKGYAIYFAADRIDQELCNRLVLYAAKKAGIIPVIYPAEVAVSKRDNLVFLSNFNDSAVEFKTGWKGRNLLGSSLRDGVITLPPRESAVVETASETP
ncbi:MAG: Beta-galactosidase BglY [Lentisphaerae bacterium ADurb.Bin242]|nr:MAG: Beta-galactosidase BglY [Lentisphaerae bacterium ADurb.Bin242]